MYDINDRRSAVLEIQKYLRRISRVGNKIPCITPDGIYGDETKRCVSEFQKINSLPVSGVVDNTTFDLLYSKYLDALYIPDEPLFLLPDKLNEGVIKEGEESVLVAIIQDILESLRVIYSDLPENKNRGVFDSATAEGVEIIQKIHGLSENGIINEATLNAIVSDYNRFKNEDT